MTRENPFEITKAVDFGDEDIERTYVPFEGRGTSGEGIVSPRTPMPVFLIGGKGGGRTHLMRHYSYPLQRSRSPLDVWGRVRDDGYLGVYFRCSGLNGSRFSARGQSAEAWTDVFGYYIDLWITELLLSTLADIAESDGAAVDRDAERLLLHAAMTATAGEPRSVYGLDETVISAANFVSALRREVDVAVNNAALTGEMHLVIRSNPGELIDAVAKAAVDFLAIPGLQITFLIDEFENLTTSQQRHFNTLLREKQRPCSFLIGSRALGVRTHETRNTGERNKQGSEFETVVIEEAYAADAGAYEEFCRRLVKARLLNSGLDDEGVRRWHMQLRGGNDSRLQDRLLLDALSKFAPDRRPHLQHLRTSVERATLDEELAGRIVNHLSCAAHPMVEKLSILRFYQIWSTERVVSEQQAERAARFVKPLIDGTESPELRNFLAQRRSDAVAQVMHEAGKDPTYFGFSQLVVMSGYLPRNLLMTLKYITRWATFFGEDAVSASQPVSARAFVAGVSDAARWYLEDSKPDGVRGEQCDVALRRLGGMLASIRLSDKPNEVNVTTFATNMYGVSGQAAGMIEELCQRGLLIEILSGRASRNRGPTHRKFQLHPMIAPLWRLSTARRGEITMTPRELDSIFDPSVDESSFLREQALRTTPLNAPFPVRSASEELSLGFN